MVGADGDSESESDEDEEPAYIYFRPMLACRMSEVEALRRSVYPQQVGEGTVARFSASACPLL